MQKSEVADNPQATIPDTELAWLAGIIDGEGSIRVDIPRKRLGGSPRIMITNNDLSIIARVVKIYRNMGLKPYIISRNRHNETYDVGILGIKKLSLVLKYMIPHLTGSKKEQAILLLKFCESRKRIKSFKNLQNHQRIYTEEEMGWIKRIKEAKKDWSLRDYTIDHDIVEEIVRTARRRVEVGRNIQPRLTSE